MAFWLCSAAGQGAHLRTLPTKKAVSKNVCHQPERLSQPAS
jgi:hypothetical protein